MAAIQERSLVRFEIPWVLVRDSAVERSSSRQRVLLHCRGWSDALLAGRLSEAAEHRRALEAADSDPTWEDAEWQ